MSIHDLILYYKTLAIVCILYYLILENGFKIYIEHQPIFLFFTIEHWTQFQYFILYTKHYSIIYFL